MACGSLTNHDFKATQSRREREENLDKLGMFYIMLDMIKKVTAREFLHQFASLEKQLRPGESITVTRRGQPLGTFTKQPVKPSIPLPDFKKDASRPGFTTEDGDALLARMLKDEELS